MWLEANLTPYDVSGVAGPRGLMRATDPVSTRHNGCGHLLFGDLHIQRVNARTAARLERSKRFWLPTLDDAYTLSPSLPDP